ncbi:hypothetical protein HDU98_000356 [Podochytrium sp. JEL0797]|nr:hypothetical protein HDU98_000356 [Podochytrium sp. JEL0797]
MTKTTIAVVGASGNIGQLTCEALLARANLDNQPVLVRALLRKNTSPSEKLQALANQHPNAFEIVTVDFESPTSLHTALTGVYAIVSTLQGLDNVLVDLQSRVLRAALHCPTVKRFIPSDFACNFTKLPRGENRNFDVRRRFHDAANAILSEPGARTDLELVSIYTGAFTEVLFSGMLNFATKTVNGMGRADVVCEFTTWKNTAEFTAAAAMDPNPIGRSLAIAGEQITWTDLQRVASDATGEEFALRVIPLWVAGGLIRVIKTIAPGDKDSIMPLYQKLQYGYSMGSGLSVTEKLDNGRYKGIVWTKTRDAIGKAWKEAKKSEQQVSKRHDGKRQVALMSAAAVSVAIAIGAYVWRNL